MSHIWLAHRQKSNRYISLSSPSVLITHVRPPHQQIFTSLPSAMAIVVISMLTINVRVTISPFMHVTKCLAVMNLSHVITEFSFGKHFPEITQPLDNSFEITHDGMLLLLSCDPCNIYRRFHCISLLPSSRSNDLRCTTLQTFAYEPVQRDTL